MKKGFLGGLTRSVKGAGVLASSVFERSHGWAAVAHLCRNYPSELPGLVPEGNVSALLITGLPSDESAAAGRCYSTSELVVFERLAATGRVNRGYVNRMAVESICPVRPDSDRITHNTRPYIIEAYANHVDNVVRKHAPNLVILAGKEAVRAVLGDGSVESYRGKPLRAHLGGRPVWVFVMHSSAEMAQIQAEGRFDKINSSEWARVLEQDVCDMLSPKYVAKPPRVVGYAEAKECGLACRYTDADSIVATLGSFTGFVAFDIETNGLRPYMSGAKILSIAISDGEKTVSFPINHPGHNWSPSEKQAIFAAILRLFMDDTVLKVAHNLPFDLEWMAFFFGERLLTAAYGDTLGQAYCVNPGPPGDGPSGLSLGQLCRQYFGFSLKKLTEGAAEVGRLEHVTTDQVCEYNALDAYWTARLHMQLRDVLDASGQGKAYIMHMERIPALVQAQLLGVPVNQEIRSKLAKDGREEIAKIEAELANMEEVRGTNLNPQSPATVGNFIVNVLKDDRVIGEDGKISTRRDVLELLAPDHRSIRSILEIRNRYKLVSTFVDRFDPNHTNALCFPDGKVHGMYKVSGTRTGRLSSTNPNCFPGYVEVLTDQGWKCWSEVGEGDRLAQYDLKAGWISFAKPVALHRYAGEQGLVRVETEKQISVDCTPDHDFWLQNRKTGQWAKHTAAEYPTDKRQPQAGVYVGGSRSVPAHEVTLIAAIQADGHVTAAGGIDFVFSKERKVDRLEQALDASSVPYTRSVRKNGQQRFYVGKAPQWMLDAKYFGPWLLDWDRAALDQLAEEVWFWDGCWDRRTMYASKHKENADWVQIVTLLSGRRARVRKYVSQRGSVSWQVDASSKSYSLTTNATVTDIGTTDATYCATMPLGTVVVRQDDRVVIAGNCQNFPKRRNKYIRSQFTAPDGWVWLACDLAQIEARVLAMASRDPRWVQSIKDGIDVHSHWAKRAAEISPTWAQMVERDFKDARSTAKNAWVFASFYGSSFKSVARNMGFEQEGPQVMRDAEAMFADFWREFAGIKAWQEGSWETYKKTGMVKSLTGRRRLAPLSWNQVINSGIQGAASDICVAAAVRLWRTSLETGQTWLTPRWIIHDDLSVMVPIEHVGYAAKLLVDAQIGFSAPWVNVPIGAELEVGIDYSKMVAVGEWFTGDDTSGVPEKTLAALS